MSRPSLLLALAFLTCCLLCGLAAGLACRSANRAAYAAEQARLVAQGIARSSRQQHAAAPRALHGQGEPTPTRSREGGR